MDLQKNQFSLSTEFFVNNSSEKYNIKWMCNSILFIISNFKGRYWGFNNFPQIIHPNIMFSEYKFSQSTVNSWSNNDSIWLDMTKIKYQNCLHLNLCSSKPLEIRSLRITISPHRDWHPFVWIFPPEGGSISKEEAGIGSNKYEWHRFCLNIHWEKS